MAMPAVLVVNVVQLSAAESGVWCPSCLLPSGVKVTVGFSTRSSVLNITDIAACHDCGQRIDLGAA